MINYTLNIDKLKLSFNNTNIELLNNTDFTFTRLPDKNSHKENYLVSYHNKPFCYIHHIHRFNIHTSSISLLNKSLYTTEFNTILSEFKTLYNIIEYKVNNIEIALNTNTHLQYKYYKAKKQNKININKTYHNYSFLDSDLRLDISLSNPIINSDTIYIKKIKDFKKGKSSIEMRIENKTIEILNSSNKIYILNYYKDRLDITKDIYRLELSLDLVNLRQDSRYTKYQHNLDYSTIISLRQFNKLDYLLQSHYTKITLKKEYIINIDLLRSENYLLSLLEYFKIFNYENIIKVNTTIDKLIFENTIVNIQRTSATNNKNDYSIIKDIENPFI